MSGGMKGMTTCTPRACMELIKASGKMIQVIEEKKRVRVRREERGKERKRQIDRKKEDNERQEEKNLKDCKDSVY